MKYICMLVMVPMLFCVLNLLISTSTGMIAQLVIYIYICRWIEIYDIYICMLVMVPMLFCVLNLLILTSTGMIAQLVLYIYIYIYMNIFIYI